MDCYLEWEGGESFPENITGKPGSVRKAGKGDLRSDAE